MFRQFNIARFMIGFIVFILAYMVASLSYDVFFHFLTGGMFLLVLWILSELQKGHREEMAKRDAGYEEKIQELTDELEQKDAELQFLKQAIIDATSARLKD